MKEKRDTKNKSSLAGKISKYRDFSIGSKNQFYMSASGSVKGKAVLTEGVKKIKKYTDELIILELCSEEVVLCGENLECLTYASGAIEISGRVNSISFNLEIE